MVSVLPEGGEARTATMMHDMRCGRTCGNLALIAILLGAVVTSLERPIAGPIAEMQNSAAAGFNIGTELLCVIRAAGAQYREGRIVLRPCQRCGLQNPNEKQQRQPIHLLISVL